MGFIHIADTHLGYEQYGLRERFNDFSRSFWKIIDDGIDRKIDFMVIAGDLFNKRAIDAQTLIHAIEGLKRLKDHNIPVITIEGNHDRSYYRDGISWLQFLCYEGYIILLAPIMQEGAPLITPWNPENMLGSYIDLVGGKVRVYGLPWQGAAITRSLEGMAQALKAARAEEDAQGVKYRLLTMHTGIDGMVSRVQGLPTMGQFRLLRDYIDYLALGHVHKPYELEGWIYNPGSPETCSAEEIQWDDRGYYYVEIDTDQPELLIDPTQKAPRHRAIRIRTQRRPFLRHELRIDGLEDPPALYAQLLEYCQREGKKYTGTEERPLVQITITGTLGFDPGALNQSYMEEMVREAFQPLHVRIDNNTNDRDYVPDDGDLDGRDRSVWHELERHVFEELVGFDTRYLPAKEQWGAVLSELKQQALNEDAPEKIAQFLREKRAALLPPT
ncbi:MAG TPA: exonuclease SbcCD subunit D [Ktedonobacteraceae bacterium]|nr:exonuclease SbcCD subunit D [Ktedonobacteraceae bacterium]